MGSQLSACRDRGLVVGRGVVVGRLRYTEIYRVVAGRGVYLSCVE